MTCAQGGVVGAVPGLIGLLAVRILVNYKKAIEAAKIVLGKGKALNGFLILFFALDMNFKKIPLRKKKSLFL